MLWQYALLLNIELLVLCVTNQSGRGDNRIEWTATKQAFYIFQTTKFQGFFKVKLKKFQVKKDCYIFFIIYIKCQHAMQPIFHANGYAKLTFYKTN